MNKETTELLFTLATNSSHILNLKQVPNIKESMGNLISMKLISKSNNCVILNEIFRKSLLKGFCINNFDRKLSSEEIQLEIESYIKESNNKFKLLLHSIVDKSATRLGIVSDMLLFCGLIDQFNNITNKGFEFLLKCRKDQMWFMLLNSIRFYSVSPEMEQGMLMDLMELIVKPSNMIYKIISLFIKIFNIFYFFVCGEINLFRGHSRI